MDELGESDAVTRSAIARRLLAKADWPGGLSAPSHGLAQAIMEDERYSPPVPMAGLKLKTIFAPIANFCRASFLKISMLDGKPGLGLGDFEVVAGWCVKAALLGAGYTGSNKREAVTKLVLVAFGTVIPPWAVQILVWLAYSYVNRLGALPKGEEAAA